jgi:hypothetical protein
MTDPNEIAAHLEPIWQGRSNFIIQAQLKRNGLTSSGYEFPPR